MRVMLIVAAMLAGCAKDPPPAPQGLARPVSWAMVRCPPMPEVPKNDGDPEVRKEAEKNVRLLYVECAAKVDVHIAYVEAVAPKK